MSSRMRVLQILPALQSGGVERGTLEIAAALQTAGHEAWVVSNGGRLVPELEALGARHCQLPVHSKHPLTQWRNHRRLITLIMRQHIDLVHVRSRAPAWPSLLATRKTARPMLATFHGKYGHRSALKRFYNSGMLRGDGCIAVSDFIATHIAETYPAFEHTPVTTIHRGIDTTLFDPQGISDEAQHALRARWEVDRKTPLILLPGRLTRLKGHHLLLQALHQLPRESFQARIVGARAGREQYVAECEQQIAALGLQRQVRFTGMEQDMATAYAISDVVVSASAKEEAFGRTICEAQAMGCAVVAADHGGARETMQHSQPHGLYTPGDARALAAALQRQLALDPTTRTQQATSSRAHIVAHFSLQQMQAKTLALYARMLAKQ